MNKLLIAGIVAWSLALACAEPALACPSRIYCSNFTDPMKRTDCNTIVSQHFPFEEQHEILCTLWDYGYEWRGYEPPHYPPLNTSLVLSYKEIDTSRFLTAMKITTFIVFNYFLYCFLTRSSFTTRWRAA